MDVNSVNQESVATGRMSVKGRISFQNCILDNLLQAKHAYCLIRHMIDCNQTILYPNSTFQSHSTVPLRDWEVLTDRTPNAANDGHEMQPDNM